MAESSRPLLSSWQIKQRFGVLELVSLSASPCSDLWLLLKTRRAHRYDLFQDCLPGATAWWFVVLLEHNGTLGQCRKNVSAHNLDLLFVVIGNNMFTINMNVRESKIYIVNLTVRFSIRGPLMWDATPEQIAKKKKSPALYGVHSCKHLQTL